MRTQARETLINRRGPECQLPTPAAGRRDGGGGREERAGATPRKAARPEPEAKQGRIVVVAEARAGEQAGGGHDPTQGRIAAAMGRSFPVSPVSVWVSQ